MAVTISKATCGKNSQEYVRDLLRNNLTDTQSPARTGSSWIFKSHEDESRVAGKFPRVYIELESAPLNRLASSVIGPVTISLSIEVWCSGTSAKSERDSISDEILEILSDNSSTDGTKTMREQWLELISGTQSNEDTQEGDAQLRKKTISVELIYRGW